MFYLIGLGLDLKSISSYALEIIPQCERIYVESYTIKLPYTKEDLEAMLRREIFFLERKDVEEESFLQEAKNKNIALLVYGSPLMATTHISLLLKCKKEKIPYRVIHNASIFDAIAETGLQIYKFGKTASMPQWSSSYKPASFLEVIKENQSRDAHTLVLIDIGLSFKDALRQFRGTVEELSFEKMLVCSMMGTERQKIFYDALENFENAKIKIEEPFCFIIPGKLHFLEEEMLNFYDSERA